MKTAEIENLISEFLEQIETETVFTFLDFNCLECFSNWNRELLENENDNLESEFCPNCNSDNIVFYKQFFKK